MNNYSDENEIMVATGLDMTALSPRSQRHLMQYMDQEGEAAFREMISTRHTVAVANYAIAAQTTISQNAMARAEEAPYASEEIANLVQDAHRMLRGVLGGGGSEYGRRY